MKTQNLRAVLLMILTFVVCGGYASAQPEELIMPNNSSLKPILEWQKFDAVKGGDGKPYLGITFGVKNWNIFPDSIFVAVPELPACGLNNNSSRTWLDIYELKTNKRLYGFCALAKAEDMKSLSFNVKGENLPDCIYITLTDRETKKRVKSNPIKANDGKGQCKTKSLKIVESI